MPLDGYIYSQRRQAASACVTCRCSQPTDLYAVDHADSGPWGLGKQFWPFELYVSQSHRWKSLTQKYAHDNSCFLNTVLVLDSSWPLSLTAPHHGSSNQLTLTYFHHIIFIIAFGNQCSTRSTRSNLFATLPTFPRTFRIFPEPKCAEMSTRSTMQEMVH